MTHVDWIALAQWLVPLFLSFFGGHQLGTNQANAANSAADNSSNVQDVPKL